jgi:hypothetical protein
MVYKCCAYGCKSGYTIHSSTTEKVTFHKFPRDASECNKWIRFNPRKDFKPSKHSRMCSLHFLTTDFVEEHQDSNKTRKKKFTNKMLLCRYLKKDAVPSVFPNAPAYLSTTPARPRSSAAAATSTGRHLKEVVNLQTLCESFETNDNLETATLDEIKSRLEQEVAPEGFQTIVLEDKLIIYLLSVCDNVLDVRASISINSSKSITVCKHKIVVPSSHYQDILPGRMVCN